MPPAGAVANPGHKGCEGSARIQKLEPLTLFLARVPSIYLSIPVCVGRNVSLIGSKKKTVGTSYLIVAYTSEATNRLIPAEKILADARTHFSIDRD
ncbi:unnamed protein product [Lasius platythorax]|uniref:Uncharacterized protein n=1 Tax=Lasius platythorax TaxID=488582 RepID=A0AAV2N663_9HYME